MDHDTRFSVCDMAAEADADVLMDIEVYVNLNGLCVKRSAGIVAVLDYLRSFKSIERFHQRLTSQTEKLSYYLVHEVPMSKRRAAEVVNMVGRTIERMPLAHYTLANSKLLFAAMTLVVRKWDELSY